MTSTIVIADDDPEMRAMLGHVFRRAGFIVHAFENGAQACAAALDLHPDVVLIDWMMPVMDGPTAAGILRAEPATARIPIVMLSGQSTVDECIHALETGVQDFLLKPCNLRELLARIEGQIRWRELLLAA